LPIIPSVIKMEWILKTYLSIKNWIQYLVSPLHSEIAICDNEFISGFNIISHFEHNSFDCEETLL